MLRLHQNDQTLDPQSPLAIRGLSVSYGESPHFSRLI